MAVTLDNQPIFGIATRVTGPIFARATQGSALPGVDGERLYDLGKRNQTWSVRGRLVSISPAFLDIAIRDGEKYMDGKLHAFDDGRGGAPVKNCQLVDFRPGAVESILYAGVQQFTCVVTATVKCLSPT